MCNAKNLGPIWQAWQILINDQLDAQLYSAPNYTAPELAELLKALLDQDVEFCENFLRSIGDRSSYGCLLALKNLSMERQIKLLPMFNIVSFSHYSMSACAGVLQNWSPENRQQFLQTIDSDGLHALFRITDESKKILLSEVSNTGREDVLNRLNTQTNTANSPSNNASAPNQLPKTGISELAGLAGTGSLGYALYAYIVSRKNR